MGTPGSLQLERAFWLISAARSIGMVVGHGIWYTRTVFRVQQSILLVILLSRYTGSLKTNILVCQEWLNLFNMGQWIMLPSYDVLWKVWSHYGRQSEQSKDGNKPSIEDVGRSTFLASSLHWYWPIGFVATNVHEDLRGNDANALW